LKGKKGQMWLLRWKAEAMEELDLSMAFYNFMIIQD